MKALIKDEPTKSYKYVDIPIPEPADDELLIKVEKVAICGSDINLYQWNAVAQVIATLPFTPGHELVGVVTKVGSKVTDIPVGQRVCVENHYYCGTCYQCTHDQTHICQNMGQPGHGKKTIHGGCSEYTIVPARFAYVLKHGIDPLRACLLEPLGVAHHALEEINIKGQDLLIIGCGPIGLFAISVAKEMGAIKIIAADIFDDKLAVAKQMGADVVINSKNEDLAKRIKEETGGNGVGRLMEASGAPPMVNNSFSYLRKGGQIVLVGLPKSPLHVENVLQDVIFKSITLKTIHGRKIFHTWEACEKLLADGKVDTNLVVSHQIPMSKFEEAFDLLISGKGCKIVMDPQA